MASTYLTRTPSSAGSNRKFTFSAWVKRADTSSEMTMVSQNNSGGTARDCIRFNGGDQVLRIFFNDASTASFASDAEHRDCNGWYHIVVNADTTQATSSDRVKAWVNGEQVTSWSTETYPSQNADLLFNSDNLMAIGRDSKDSNAEWNGLMSHVHFIDGTAYDASALGETDANGVWKIKTSPSVTYGTNGCFILKDGNSVTDQSGNGNNFTVAGGTLTNTEDNPSNVFATLNPLVPDAGSTGLYHGNNQFNVDTASWRTAFSTLAMSSGKYYFESQIQAGTYIRIGARAVDEAQGYSSADYVDRTTNGYSYDKNGTVRKNDTTVTDGDTGVTYGNTDIIGCLLDLDNWTINWTKNGTLVNSTAYNITQNLTYVFGVSGNGTARILTNFGNGNFSNTAVSSAGTNASGIGIFEYDVPTGYTALSTKGLNL